MSRMPTATAANSTTAKTSPPPAPPTEMAAPAAEEYAGAMPTLQFIDPLGDDEFRAALQTADVLIVNEKPGVSEMSVPSKLTSYFDTGRPVVAATEAGGVTAHEVQTADAGLVVESGRAQQLVDACLSLRDDPSLASRLGANGRRYREAVLSEDAAIDRFVQLLVSVPPRRRP